MENIFRYLISWTLLSSNNLVKSSFNAMSKKSKFENEMQPEERLEHNLSKSMVH